MKKEIVPKKKPERKVKFVPLANDQLFARIMSYSTNKQKKEVEAVLIRKEYKTLCNAQKIQVLSILMQWISDQIRIIHKI